MQKPETSLAVPHGQRGSVLVAVVAFSVLIGIAVAGYMSLSGSTTNHEAAALQDAKAFHAAESGLLMGTRWLRDVGSWETYQNSGSAHVWSGVINDMNVDVNVVKSGTDIVVQSDATGAGLVYARKRVSWGVVKIEATNPGVFINTLQPGGTVGGTGLNNTWFDGPFHSNTPLYISSVSGGTSNVGVKFMNGRVTTFNKTNKVNFNPSNFLDPSAGHWGNYGKSTVTGNDYNFGIWNHDAKQNNADAKKPQTDISNNLDPLFEHAGQYVEFKHSQDSLYMPPVQGGYPLPQNQSTTQQAILNFYVDASGGRATYYYYNAAGVQQTPVDFSVEHADAVVTSNILRINNDVKVLGTVKGQATVVTNTGYNILPVGDLKYNGFTPDMTAMDSYNNSGNYGLGDVQTNSSIVALVSGKDIVFGLQKYKIDISNSNIATLSSLNSQSANAESYQLDLTAQLIATEKGHGIVWEDADATKFCYVLRELGSRTIDQYNESSNAQGTKGHVRIRFYYDTRLGAGLKAPGVPAIQSGQGNQPTVRLKGDWREQNLTS